MVLTKEEFQAMLKDAVKGTFDGLSEESRADKLNQLVVAAESTITDLNKVVEDKEAELAKAEGEKKALSEQVEELVAKNKQLEEQLAAREAELKDASEKHASAEQRATAAETVLAEQAAARTLEARVAELAAAKVLKSGEKLEGQKTKIASMSDEEFAAYRDELVDVRAEVEALLKDTAGEAVTEEEVVVEVAPPDINKEEAAAAGALDIESVETSTKSKYADFSVALAKRMRNE